MNFLICEKRIQQVTYGYLMHVCTVRLELFGSAETQPAVASIKDSVEGSYEYISQDPLQTSWELNTLESTDTCIVLLCIYRERGVQQVIW